MHTRTRLARRTAALAPLVAVALLLSACSGGDSDGDSGDDASPTSGASQGADKGDKDSDGDTDSDSADGDTDAGGAASEGASCLEGSWAADMTRQIEAAQQALEAAQLEATLEMTGDVTMTFSGGTATYTYGKQVTDVTMSMEGQEVRSVTTLDGTMSGTYTATDTDVTVTIADASTMNITMQTFMGDTPVEAGLDGYADAMRESLKSSSTVAYTCAGDTLTIAMTNASLGSAVETVLHRK